MTFFIWLVFVTIGQENTVSPKLDFDDSESKENASVPVVTGVGQSRPHVLSGSGSSSKTRPKIHGVRVTVDTGDNHQSKESKESVEITDGGKNTKRVGIHTDITFEISADGAEDSNTTSAQREDASVPIYKGRGGSSIKSRKPYDPKANWNPNFSAERRGYDISGRAGYGSRYPQYPQHVPLYTGIEEARGSSNTNRKADGWHSYVPLVNAWTTERYHAETYKPNAVNGYRVPSWQPCYCMSSDVDSRRRRDNQRTVGVFKPTSAVIEIVDDKLERPFSKK